MLNEDIQRAQERTDYLIRQGEAGNAARVIIALRDEVRLITGFRPDDPWRCRTKPFHGACCCQQANHDVLLAAQDLDRAVTRFMTAYAGPSRHDLNPSIDALYKAQDDLRNAIKGAPEVRSIDAIVAQVWGYKGASGSAVHAVPVDWPIGTKVGVTRL